MVLNEKDEIVMYNQLQHCNTDHTLKPNKCICRTLEHNCGTITSMSNSLRVKPGTLWTPLHEALWLAKK